MKKSLTPLLTTGCAATVIGIVSLGNAEPAAKPQEDIVAYIGASRAAADTTNEAAASHLEQVHVATVRAVNQTDLDLAAFRWHERLEEARQEAYERAGRQAATPAPRPRETADQRRERQLRDRQVQIQNRQRNRQLAEERRARSENESIFTRSRSYRRQGSMYPATRLNHEMRRVQRRRVNNFGR
ncbi:MAG: hypothetical protein ACYTGP_11625 [Planctomycetota bacterium]|jgi:hypothetical protein